MSMFASVYCIEELPDSCLLGKVGKKIDYVCTHSQECIIMKNGSTQCIVMKDANVDHSRRLSNKVAFRSDKKKTLSKNWPLNF